MATFNWYEEALVSFFSKKIDYINDTIYVALVKAAYTPNASSDQYWSVASASEISNGNGYTTNGEAVTGKSLTISTISGHDYLLLVGANSSWSGANWSSGNGPRYAVMYDSTPGTAATDPVIGYVDFGAEQNPAGVQFLLSYEVNNTYNTLLKVQLS